ncbi:MAG: phenylalanine--tRNA ligase subunit alpha [Eubacteriales bacterium]|nr:phenylalanine--tRNA ligase subunit alpha [Eubacteriales bacterium]
MQDLLNELKNLKAEFETGLDSIKESKELDELRLKFLGKKGKITAQMKNMAKLSAEDRPVFGAEANRLRQQIEAAIQQAAKDLESARRELQFKAEELDVTRPGRALKRGLAHPITQVIDEISEVFFSLGFALADGPEVEFIKNNFDLLRIAEGHPARDFRDTFYINDEAVLRTQTSPVQIRTMQSQEPPIKIICPGRCYRSDTPDATHSPVFHQIEGLVIDHGIAMSDLVGHLELFAKAIFGQDTKIRLRPHHFPFTEPSCEVDISCWACHGVDSESCSTCRGETWVEILGAGMVHPEVIENCGLDSKEYSGFAFGLGVERTAMGRYGIDDIRRFYENDLRFLRQFH